MGGDIRMSQNPGISGLGEFTTAEQVFLQNIAGHTYTDGQLLIGNSSTGSLSFNTLIAGTGVTITNGNGTITVAAASGGGDFSSNTSSSVDSEIVLFSGTGGKTGKRATGTGIAKITSGVLSTATAGTDYQAPITLTTTGSSGAATFTSNILNIPQYTGNTYTAGTGLTLTTGAFSVNTSQSIATLSNLTSNGLVTTSGGAGTLGVTVPGTGVLTALAVNVGSAGAFVTFNGALGTPSSGTVTNLTGTASININGTVGATTPGAGTFTTLIANSFVPNSSTVPSNGIYLPAANTLGFAINTAIEAQLTATAFSPGANAGNSLGVVNSLAWAGLALSSGAAIDWNNSTMTITQSGAVLTVGGGDLKISATAGVTTTSVVTNGGTQTLTNKRITKRTGTTTSSTTPTINTDIVDFYSLTAQTADITSFTTNLSGTPTENQTLWIAITGTAARAITWGTSFEASTVALPTTTVTTNRLDIGFVWNTVTSKWRCIAVA